MALFVAIWRRCGIIAEKMERGAFPEGDRRKGI